MTNIILTAIIFALFALTACQVDISMDEDVEVDTDKTTVEETTDEDSTEDDESDEASEEESEDEQPAVELSHYSNGEYTFSYPKNWTVAEDEHGRDILTVHTPDNEWVAHMIVYTYYSAEDLPNNSDAGLDFETWIDDEYDTYLNSFDTINSYVLDGIEGYMLYASTGKTGASRAIMVEHEGVIYHIVLTALEEDHSISDNDLALLSSFSFL